MEAADALAPAAGGPGRRIAQFFQGRPRLTIGSLLAGPVGWLVIGYLGSLAVLFAASFWSVNSLTGVIAQTFTLNNFETLVNGVYVNPMGWL